MSEVHMEEREFAKRTRAIVQFGPATPVSGFKAGEFYEVVIDPDMTSPSGEYIRFQGNLPCGNEIHGWQRVEALTVCEVLQEGVEYEAPAGCIRKDGAKVVMRCVK